VKRSDKRDIKILTQAKLKKFLYIYLIQGGLKVRKRPIIFEIISAMGKCSELKL